MSSPPSSSDSPDRPPESSASSAFERLDEGVQRWLWKQGWKSLRPIQEAAVAPIMEGDHGVILAAPTAGGKTEAAFLPIVSRLAGTDVNAMCVCVSPLKALINDQYERLVDICGAANVPVWRWHGDVGQSHKNGFLNAPTGVLLITPESLEAHLVRRGPQAKSLFGNILYVVVDELHAFMGTDRGKQLQSLLHRLDLINRRAVPRVALSATLGDMNLAADFLRPMSGSAVVRIEEDGDGQELKLLQRGYRRRPPDLTAGSASDGGHSEPLNEQLDDLHDIAAHLFKVLRGSDNLIFANSRTNVEFFADLLRRMSEKARVPNEFLPHHGSLSQELREYAERELKKESRPGNIVATTTLEMGIDVGTVRSIAQIGNPPSVASMRQRLGRSGRDQHEAAILRIYISEQDGGTALVPQDSLRAQTVQSIAMVQLMLDGWLEPPDNQILNLSTLIQQLLAIVAQHGGVRAPEAWSVLCGEGPFRLRDQKQFTALLRSMGERELLTQTSDGLLVLGLRGERIVDHYEFYAAFFTPQEFQLAHEGRSLGNLPITKPVTPNSHLIFGGRRWEVVDVDIGGKVISVKPSKGGRPPMFDGGPAPVHDKVRQQMFEVYRVEHRPSFTDATAQALLKEGRQYFRTSGLERRQIVETSTGCHVFPWVGDKTMNTLELLLATRGITITNEGMSLNSKCSEAELLLAVQDLLQAGLPTPNALAAVVANKFIGKYDEFLSEELLNENFASARLDVDGARGALQKLARGSLPKARDRFDVE